MRLCLRCCKWNNDPKKRLFGAAFFSLYWTIPKNKGIIGGTAVLPKKDTEESA